MLVLGIDPGTAITGWGVVRQDGDALVLVAYGTVNTSQDVPMPQRLQTIHRELGEIISQHGPDGVAVEKLFFSKNVRTAMSVGHARGVALLALADAGLPLGEYTPLEIKKAITGYGAADKHQVQEMVRILLGMADIPRPHHAADALAVAICHLHTAGTRSLLNP